MTAPAPPRARQATVTLLVALGAVLVAAVLVVWNNLVVPHLPADPGVRTIANVALVAVLVAGARTCGLTWADLGLCRTTWREGALWGGGAVAVAALVYVVAYLLPVTRPLLERPGVGADPTSELLLRALVIIPIGTVLCEELAFRGVLHALGVRVLPARAALVVGASVFGAWHVAGAMAAPVTEAGLPPGMSATALAVVVVVGVTVPGGVVLAAVRRRTGSLLAPIGVHLGTNVIGLVAVVLATR